MSKADIERFIEDLKSNPDLMNEVQASPGNLSSVVELAKSKGYDVSLDEAQAYVRGQADQTLSDEQLDAIAGGKGHHHSAPPGAVQTIVAATTAAAAATVGAAIVIATT